MPLQMVYLLTYKHPFVAGYVFNRHTLGMIISFKHSKPLGAEKVSLGMVMFFKDN